MIPCFRPDPVDWHPASAPAASVEPATTNCRRLSGSEGFDESVFIGVANERESTQVCEVWQSLQAIVTPWLSTRQPLCGSTTCGPSGLEQSLALPYIVTAVGRNSV
jgi:hypothetical protein